LISDARAGERGDAVIHLAQYGDVEVAEIARDEKGRDLARSVREQFVAGRPAFDDQMDMVGPVALANDVASGTHLPGVETQGRQRPAVLVRQPHDRLQLRDKRNGRPVARLCGDCGH
jgi:hypothetical protein